MECCGPGRSCRDSSSRETVVDADIRHRLPTLREHAAPRGGQRLAYREQIPARAARRREVARRPVIELRKRYRPANAGEHRSIPRDRGSGARPFHRVPLSRRRPFRRSSLPTRRRAALPPPAENAQQHKAAENDHKARRGFHDWGLRPHWGGRKCGTIAMIFSCRNFRTLEPGVIKSGAAKDACDPVPEGQNAGVAFRTTFNHTPTPSPNCLPLTLAKS